MTIELSLSLMNMHHGQDKLQAILKAFEVEHGVHVNLTHLEWTEGWAELSRYAANEKGPDVSEIGSTWLPGLIAANGLTPFFPAELDELGGAEAFFPPSWDGVLQKGRPYAVPWFCDVRLLYYRRDHLAKVNLSPDQSFSSPEQFLKALQNMHQAGIPNLWAIPTWRHANNVHMIASWVWGAGGDLVSADGKKLVFDQPEALHGITQYFLTTRFMDGDRVAGITDPDLIELYIHDKLSMFPSGPWVAMSDLERAVPAVRQNCGVAPMPGVSFVGGTHLIVWRHSRKRDLSIQLLKYLTSQSIQADLYPEHNMLPANQKALEAQQGMTYVEEIMKAIQTGRSFPVLPFWSKVEDRLVAELNGVWADVLAMPAEEVSYDSIRKIVDVRMVSAVRRLNMAIFA